MKKYLLLVALACFCQQVFSQKNIICTNSKHKESTRLYSVIMDSKSNACFSDGYYLWDNGKTLCIKFLNGSKVLKQQFEKHLKEIETYANIKFRVVESESHIRVKFSNNSTVFSEIGTIANLRMQEEATAELDSTNFQKNPKLFRALVLHIACHMLGFQDEIFATTQGAKLNKQSFQKNYPSLFKDTTSFELFQSKYLFNCVNQPKYDASSILVAPLSKQIAINSTAISWNLSFSENDKLLLSALYPKKHKSTDTIKQHSTINFKNLVIKYVKEKQGFLIYPQFNFYGSPTSTFHFAVFVVDEHGKEIMVDYGDFENNLAGRLGDGKTFARIFNKPFTVNDKQLCDIQFFIREKYILSSPKNKKRFIVFKVFEDFDGTEQAKTLFESKPFVISE